MYQYWLINDRKCVPLRQGENNGEVLEWGVSGRWESPLLSSHFSVNSSKKVVYSTTIHWWGSGHPPHLRCRKRPLSCLHIASSGPCQLVPPCRSTEGQGPRWSGRTPPWDRRDRWDGLGSLGAAASLTGSACVSPGPGPRVYGANVIEPKLRSTKREKHRCT